MRLTFDTNATTTRSFVSIISTLTIENPNGGVVNLNPEISIGISDISGNNNQQVNPDESIELTIPIKNFGNSNITNLTIGITSSSDFVNIINDEVLYNNLGSGAIADVSGLTFQLDSGAKHNENLEMILLHNVYILI